MMIFTFLNQRRGFQIEHWCFWSGFTLVCWAGRSSFWLHL